MQAEVDAGHTGHGASKAQGESVHMDASEIPQQQAFEPSTGCTSDLSSSHETVFDYR